MVLPDMTLQLLASEYEDAAPTTLELEPSERHARPSASNEGLGVTHLDDEDAARGEMIRRFLEDDANRIETLFAGCQGHARLVPILRRQSTHFPRADVGGIGHNDIVPTPLKGSEVIRFDEAYATR
jgi:hypothetical protein